MILPTKCLMPEMALLTIGADILNELHQARPVLEVWERVQAAHPETSPDRSPSFDWFILAVNFLYAASIIDYNAGLLSRGVHQ